MEPELNLRLSVEHPEELQATFRSEPVGPKHTGSGGLAGWTAGPGSNLKTGVGQPVSVHQAWRSCWHMTDGLPVGFVGCQVSVTQGPRGRHAGERQLLPL